MLLLVSMGRARRTMGLLAFGVLATGCSISFPRDDGTLELVTGYLHQDPRGTVVDRLALGIDIRLAELTRGITLGYDHSTIVRPQGGVGPPQEVERPSWGFAPPAGIRVVTTNGEAWSIGWVYERTVIDSKEPVFVFQASTGATIAAAPHRKGVGLGFERATTIHLDPERDQAFVLRFSTDDPARSSLQPLEIPRQ